MTNSFNNLLITLTIFDTTFIVFMLFDYTSFRGNSSRYHHQLSLTQTFHVLCKSISLFTFHFHSFHFHSPVWQWPLSHKTAVYAYIFPKVYVSSHLYIWSYFSKFLFPLNNIALSCSIYSTVGIAYERLDKKIHNCSFTWDYRI